MNPKINFLICKNRDILTKMIEDNQPYEKILEQSQLLDQYILLAIKDINKIES